MNNITKAKLALALLGGSIIAGSVVPTGYGFAKDLSAFKRTSLSKQRKANSSRNAEATAKSMGEMNSLLSQIANSVDRNGAYPRAIEQRIIQEPLI